MTLAVFFALGLILLLLAGDHPNSTVRSVLREAGVVTVGTVFVTLVYEFVLRPVHDRQLLDVVRDSLIAHAGAYGLQGIVTLDFSELFERLRAGDELCWLDTYCPDMDSPKVQSALLSAVKRGATIRMLVINPECATAKARADEIVALGYQSSDFKKGAQRNLSIIARTREDLGRDGAARLIVRTYSDLPCAPVYFVVRNGATTAGWSSYFLSLPTYESAHLFWGRAQADPQELVAPGMGLDAFQRYFDRKWQRAKPVDQSYATTLGAGT